MANHTFLFNAAVWEVMGDYFDHTGKKFPMEGITRVEHKKNVWMNDMMMKVKEGAPKEFFNFCEVNPMADDQKFSFWRSENTAMGCLTGLLILSGDDMFINWNAADGKHSGTIHLHMIDKQYYTHNGFVFEGKKRLSNWELRLKRV